MTIIDIAVFLFVLGLLIFVHEFGHFLAAKMCGIYVDRFSLGMPPRIFGLRYGETDYCIGALPIGGYVKMAGQEDSPLSEEERQGTYGHVPPERWYNNKPKHQRAFVLIAGPAMNLLLGFVIYLVMTGIGGEVPLTQVDNRVGVVQEDSPAANAPLYAALENGARPEFDGTPDAAGLQTGDRILRANGNEVHGIIEVVAVEAVLNEGKTSIFEIERAMPDGSTKLFYSPVESKVMDESKLARFGIEPYAAGLVEQVRPGMAAEEAGLRNGDVIVRADGEPVDRNAFSDLVRKAPAGAEISITVLRGGDPIELPVKTSSRGEISGIAFTPPLDPFVAFALETKPTVVMKDPAYLDQFGIREGDTILSVKDVMGTEQSFQRIGRFPSHTRLTVSFGGASGAESTSAKESTLRADQLAALITGMPENSPVTVAGISEEAKTKTGLQQRDRLVEIGGGPASIGVLRDIQQDLAGGSVSIKVKRPEILRGIWQGAKEFDAQIEVASVQEIGVIWGVEKVFYRVPPSEVVPAAWDRTVGAADQVASTLWALVTRQLSPKLLGGPVMIYEATTIAAKTNFVYFLGIIAMISVNLCIFNLLPLPVLDGGQLMFIGIEAIRRRPVSIRIQEAVQQVGLLLIVSLLIFVTFNDVSRVLNRFLP